MKNNKNIKNLIGLILISYFIIPIILAIGKSLLDILGLYGVIDLTLNSHIGHYLLNPPQLTPFLIVLIVIVFITAFVIPLFCFIGGILLLKSKPIAKKFVITILGTDLFLKTIVLTSNIFINIPGSESGPIKSIIFYIFIIFEVLTIIWLVKEEPHSTTT